MILVFDVETTGKADFQKLPEWPGQPRIVQIASMLVDDAGESQSEMNFIIRPDGFEIPADVAAIHGITTEHARKFGIPIQVALDAFFRMSKLADLLVAFNISFDELLIRSECHRASHPDPFAGKKTFCAMREATGIVKLPGTRVGNYKWPKLQEAHTFFFNSGFDGAHDAMADVKATAKVFFAIKSWRRVEEKENAPSLEKGSA